MMESRRPAYAFPVPFIARWLRSWALRRPRDLGRDGAWIFAERPSAPRVLGEHHIPERGVFIAVMNHYEAPGLRVWWPALLVSSRIARRRREPLPLRWLIADRFYRTRWHGVPIPDGLVAWAFRQVARAYDAIVVSRRDPHARATALRRASRGLRSVDAPRPLGVTPEGALASGGVLARPVANSAPALAWLSRDEIPLLPVAVYEDAADALTVVFGEPFTLPWPGLRAARRDREALTRRVMGALAGMLPAGLRGPFAEPPPPAPAGDAGADAGGSA